MKNLSLEQFKKKIDEIQTEWAQTIINIGKAYLDNKDYVTMTEKFIKELYSLDNHKTLFKPTKASNIQFRRKRNEFISYFIGHNKVSEEDKGFAINPWKKIKFENFDFSVFDNFILAMGNYFFTDYNDITTKVEYSFGYILVKDKSLKIVFHHSSIPYEE